MAKTTATPGAAGFQLDQQGRFILEDYNRQKPFSNFFPGIAGLWGIPMWVFYVNRGQAIASLGIESKDQAILEFQPANKAYRLTARQGFRTFIKIRNASTGKVDLWEPFQDPGPAGSAARQRMIITSHDLTIEDTHPRLGLTARVNYFTIANEPFPGLVRGLTLENHGRRDYDIELIDGLPMIVPYGMKDWLLKNMSRTVEAWVKVDNLANKAPYYRLKVEVNDTASVTHIREGNFYFAFERRAAGGRLLTPIVDPALVFGPAADFAEPHAFAGDRPFRVAREQQTSNRTPAAMSLARFSLSRNAQKEIVSLVGHTRDAEQLNAVVAQALAKGFVGQKAAENLRVVETVKGYALTSSASPEFDQYTAQTFLDNVLRGGLPVSLRTGEGNIAFNVFSRKHGDLERDYNYFSLAPTMFSQGNGNYRDVNQNRRNDVWFNRDVGDSSIINFLSLIQADGYNPLVVKGLSFSVENPDKMEQVLKECVRGESAALREFLLTGFQPGQLLHFVETRGIALQVSREAFLGAVLGICHKNELADHGEGFWVDHWTYNLDLIESYLAVYPEARRELLLEKKVFSFYHDAHYVLPRSQRYLLTPNGVRQYHAVKNDAKNIDAAAQGYKLRVADGTGEVYYVNLLVKLLCLVATKAATFDPSGIGIEMEAGKPSWYDALNGLPGLLGSSLCETLELKRLCRFLLASFTELGLPDGQDVWVYSELATLITGLRTLFLEERDPCVIWHKANDIKEDYRSRVRRGIEGGEHDLTVGQIQEFLQVIVARCDAAIAKAADKKGLIATYFTHEVVDYALLEQMHQDQNYVLPISFKCRALPLFLEGFVHLLRTQPDPAEARKIYQRLRKSPLYDSVLKMYKVNADLSGESEEVGRTRIFPAGWLENESIWLHMEYKYCLELLRAGLYDEFYETFQDILIPFQPPRRYGRSPLENSSFIVSSAHEDRSLHGQGFVARLSGSTAEFIHMWLWMNVGPAPFVMDENHELTMRLRPALPAWLFTRAAREVSWVNAAGQHAACTLPKNSYAFQLSGSTLVVYHNPSRKDTYGTGQAVIAEIDLKYPGKKGIVTINGPVIPAPYAEDIRDQKLERIDVHLV